MHGGMGESGWIDGWVVRLMDGWVAGWLGWCIYGCVGRTGGGLD